MSKRNYFLLSAQCAALCVAFCAMLCACPFEDSSPEVAGAEYIDANAIKVTLFIPDGAVPYEVGDDTLAVYSVKHDLYYRITGTIKLSETEYKCILRRDLKPGDRVRVSGCGSLSGDVFFDVPEGE